MHSDSEKWREIAEAILQENDPDSVSRLVTDLCRRLTLEQWQRVQKRQLEAPRS
jgi:hypothetical protein